MDNSSSIFEENNSFNDQNLNSDDLNDQTLENKLKRLKHHIAIQDINFNIRDELIHFNNEIEAYKDKSINNHFRDQILDLLRKMILMIFVISLQKKMLKILSQTIRK